MVNTIRSRSNSSSSRAPLPCLSQGGASIPQGSLSPSQPNVTTPQTPSSEMENRKIDAETRGEIVDVGKIADNVLGKRSSHIIGLGYGPKPNKSNSGIRILQETLKEKDRECVALREERDTLMEEMNDIKSTLAEHSRLYEKLVQSQNLSSPW
ncbi:hypothetical protein BUALT_BualtUnG0057900 [Buddleja alternifolia]|uniref:Uncharacterized protein n=1 Tax=Buddleja alternifolia TaxID=168488 RepID=A0AAV6W3A2_9LAMI|nr:hypothetical protein BUALT_BualtUnG0057900 [Buddleja alternifolia]